MMTSGEISKLLYKRDYVATLQMHFPLTSNYHTVPRNISVSEKLTGYFATH